MSDWPTYVDVGTHLAITHPPDWHVHGDRYGTLVYFAAPQPQEVDGVEFVPNVNVMKMTDQGAADIRDVSSSQLESLAQWLTDARVIDWFVTEIDGRPSSCLLTSYRQGIYSCTMQQWLVRADGHMVAISGVAQSAHAATVLDDFERIARSLHIDA